MSIYMKKIHLLGLNQKWVPGVEFYLLHKYLKNFGYKVSKSKFAVNSIVYLASKYSLKWSYYHLLKNKVVFDYYHGNPETHPEFINIFNFIIKNQKRFHRIRITNSKIKKLFEKNCIGNKSKIIPIGINLEDFKIISENEKKEIKNKLRIPGNMTVIGSFQKDGVGWDGGDKPKLIKGPDILVSSIKKINEIKKNIFVLLLGPSRNYIKKELSKLNIPFLHIIEKDNLQMYKYYNLLDLYLITSRDEGGPKSLLESMACKIPVISTPVGQCVDIINKNNGILCETFSPDEISNKGIKIINNLEFSKKLVAEGFATSKLHSLENQKSLWNDFLSF